MVMAEPYYPSMKMKRDIMADIELCPFCEQMTSMELVDFPQEAEIKGRKVSFTSPAFRCSSCGHELFTPEQMDASLRASREAYEQKYATPSPEELIALRTRYGASQKAFSLLLGFGELTMNSYEQGNVPDSANRLLLKLAENPVCFSEMYRINKDKIGLIQRRRIEESEGYKTGCSWSAIPGLSAELSELEKGKVEYCAKSTGVLVHEKITTYVRDESFKEFSKLVQEAQYSSKETNVSTSIAPDPCQEIAS